jgi:alpha-glucuronidase
LLLPLRTYTLILLLFTSHLHAEDGYRLWLRYDKADNSALLARYQTAITGIHIDKKSFQAAAEELSIGLQGLLGKKIAFVSSIQEGTIVAGTPGTSAIVAALQLAEPLKDAGKDGFVLLRTTHQSKKIIVIAANSNAGVLYGSFHLLRLLQMQRDISKLIVIETPKSQLRLLNHWDNLDRHVERGYAGISIWDWHRLPDYIDPRYKDYARANASVGINGTVLTNVNANARVLTPMYLEKVKALADVFRAYGIKVYLTARFSAPVEIGGLKTADPLSTEVQQWWKNKVDEIYKLIPDFGGFLVKANSEGQPGPQNYGRTHADGANMFAAALAPHGGIVMWRAFVYSNETPDDRFKQAYNEFKPLDGKFLNNVLVQVKNGPIDFQPREPFHPLFGEMTQSRLMMEFQLTQEYLGFATHLVYLPVMFKEVLNSDTYTKGKGTTVAQTISGMAGVANIGNERNWTGHPFGQANWYALGRLAWDNSLTAETIADEWIRQTFSNKKLVIDTVKKMMLASHEAVVNYMTPLGLHHIMGYGHHYGPAPWYDKAPRADWNSVYFHRADNTGIGFDRTASGSNAVAQYDPAVGNRFASLSECPEKYLLWFHHVSWDHTMRSGRSLWEELCHLYNKGVMDVQWMQEKWNSLGAFIDSERFEQVKMLLNIQHKEASWWRNACLSYFQTFAGKPVPATYAQPAHTLEYYKSLNFPYAPGN